MPKIAGFTLQLNPKPRAENSCPLVKGWGVGKAYYGLFIIISTNLIYQAMRSFLLLHCCTLVAAASSPSELWKAAKAAVTAADESDEGADWTSVILDRSSKNQDAYVSASPLSVAAVCSDGISLVSLHFGLELNDDNDDAQSSSQTEGNELLEVFNDLPLSSRGPLRIEPIYDNGATTN